MKKTIVHPLRFVVGPGVVGDVGAHAAALGTKAFIVGAVEPLRPLRTPLPARSMNTASRITSSTASMSIRSARKSTPWWRKVRHKAQTWLLPRAAGAW